MAIDLSNLSANQDLIITGAVWLALHHFGVIDLVKDRIAGRNGNTRYKVSATEKEARDTTRQMISEIHSMTDKQGTRTESQTIETVKHTELLREMNQTLHSILELRGRES
jgi:hypothetical protein